MNYCSYCGAPLKEELPTTCSRCNTKFWKNPRCCAGALTIKDGSILLVRRLISPWSGFWDIPGGFCESNEHPSICAVRETFEETSIKIQITKFHGIWMDSSDNPVLGDSICIYYLAVSIDNPTGKPDGKETNEVGWFPFNALPEKIAFPYHIPDVLRVCKDEYKLNQEKNINENK
ncbi:NUDIX hydrolase [bacterium]|nr:NUDIX hydrolase [bacterium]